MTEPKTNNSNTGTWVAIVVALITCCGVVLAALIGNLSEIIKLASAIQPTATTVVIPINAPTQRPAPSDSGSSDKRDIAAQNLGYPNLEDFMSAYGIATEIKPRIYVCPNEEAQCLSVYEQRQQPDFHFTNPTSCTLDGKQANGTSTIPPGYDGMVKGFTVRPCR